MSTGTLVDVVMPQMGVSVSEGTVVTWRKQVGEPVKADETIVEISTDKVDTEVPAPASGTVRELLVAEGETVDVGTRIAVIDTGGGPAPAASAPSEAPAAPAAEAPAAPLAPTGDTASPAASAAESPDVAPPPSADAPHFQAMPVVGAPAAAAAPVSDGNGESRDLHSFMSPVVARMVAEHGLDIAQIPGSGRGGRVTKRDVEVVLGGGAPAEAPASAPAPAAAPVPAAPAVPTVQAPTGATPSAPSAPAAGDETLEPMSNIRKVIARNLRASVDTAVHVSTFFEVDMTRCWQVRAAVNKELAASYGVKASFLPFIMRATVEAIQHWPWVNAEVRGTDILVKRHVNLGVAVSINDGKDLVVPVIHHAEELNLLGLTRALTDLAERGRTKQLTADEMAGGTFSLTNPGGFGTLLGTPIIPPPQVAIMGVNAIVKRPVVVTDELGADSIAIRQMMLLALSYDHRLVDGAYAAQFLALVKRHLETWDAAEYGV
ncbi:MAG TPA: dihydrolipoamide acetyltransferase family protein [Gaiellales bacterium]|nr:dihydrolipoamide acetyltransferase family protein [Gaiellales bacterium]